MAKLKWWTLPKTDPRYLRGKLNQSRRTLRLAKASLEQSLEWGDAFRVQVEEDAVRRAQAVYDKAHRRWEKGGCP